MMYQYYNDALDTMQEWYVSYRIDPGQKGSMSGHPDNWSESFGPEMTQMDVLDESGLDITSTLPDELLKEIELKCWDDANEYVGDY